VASCLSWSAPGSWLAVRRTAKSIRLRLGFVSAVLAAEIVEALRRFRETHSSVQIVLHDLPPAEQLRLIAQGKLDAGFVGLAPIEHPLGVRFVRWCKERLLVFVPSGHPLAHRASVGLAELRKERFVAVSGEAAPAFSVFVHDLCRKAGFRPRIVLESSRAQAVAVMVAAGSGVAILPESLMGFTGASAAGIPLKGSPAITHVFALAAARTSSSIESLLKLLAQPA
jgi:DNA-binding transcriptional LysR family regulator